MKTQSLVTTMERPGLKSMNERLAAVESELTLRRPAGAEVAEPLGSNLALIKFRRDNIASKREKERKDTNCTHVQCILGHIMENAPCDTIDNLSHILDYMCTKMHADGFRLATLLDVDEKDIEDFKVETAVQLVFGCFKDPPTVSEKTMKNLIIKTMVYHKAIRELQTKLEKTTVVSYRAEPPQTLRRKTSFFSR